MNKHSSRRNRKRGNGGRRGKQQRAKVYDSNGPDVRIRGTAYQVTDKYMALAKDAASSGNTVLSESYMQYAEHYQRIINGFDETLKNIREQEKQQNQTQDKHNSQPSPDKHKANGKDDLGLPDSILGKSSKVNYKENNTHTEEMATT